MHIFQHRGTGSAPARAGQTPHPQTDGSALASLSVDVLWGSGPQQGLPAWVSDLSLKSLWGRASSLCAEFLEVSPYA